MRRLLRPLSLLYGSLASLHREIYRKGIKKSISVGKPVISIGNLTVGGTGKTPFVLGLVKDLEKRGLRPAVVVRSYLASLKGSHELSLRDAKDPTRYGDEASVYKIKNPQLSVYTGPSKLQSAQMAAAEPDIDIILVDDGFQHHKLKKDWNGVMIDATRAGDLQPLPEGKLREGMGALKWADAIFLSRVELVDPKLVEDLRSLFPSDKPVFRTTTKFCRLRTFDGQVVEQKFKRVGLVCALGNPTQFEKFFKKHFPGTSAVTFFYRDHHDYTSMDVGYVEAEMGRQNFEMLVTTEKDEGKIRKFAARPHDWAVMDIESQLVDEKEWQNYWDKTVNELVDSNH